MDTASIPSNRNQLLATLALLVSTVFAADAPAAAPKTLRTGALVPNGTTFCTLTNLGPKSIDVTFVMRNNQGAPVTSQTKPVAPGQSEQINASISFDLTRCEFVFSGSTKKVRAAIQLPDGSTSEAR